jgi:hypothetical protein
MAAKNTKKTSKTPLKKSAMKKVHGGTDDSASGVGSVNTAKGGNIMPPILIGKALDNTAGSEVTPLGSSGLGSRR